MVLLCSEEKKVSQIAKFLKRNPHTFRAWLKRYNAHGIKGLRRKYSPWFNCYRRSAGVCVLIQKICLALQ